MQGCRNRPYNKNNQSAKDNQSARQAQRQHLATLKAFLLEMSRFELKMMTGMNFVPSRQPDDDWDEELPEVEILDPPEFEDNIETGEAVMEELIVDNVQEDPWQYVGRMLQFYYNDDIPRDIEEAFVAAQRSEKLPDNPELSEFFEDVLKDLPLSLNDDIITVHEPDIIFKVSESGGIEATFNMDLIEQIFFCSNENQQLQDLCKNRNISLKILYDGLLGRRQNLQMLANFLADHQKDFLMSSGMTDTVRRFRQLSQRDFVDYVRDKVQIEEFDRSRASRTIKNTWIRLPFQEEPIPANLFFSKTPYRIIFAIADAATAIMDSRPIAAPVYNLIYRLITKVEITTRQMQIYIRELRSVLPGENGSSRRTLGGISDETLLEIAKLACEKLEMPTDKNLDLDAVQRIRSEMREKR